MAAEARAEEAKATAAAERNTMAQLNFRIGAKLGLTAAIGVVLVGGMLVNQLYGNQSIATTSGLVIANFSNKSNAQATDNGVMRAAARHSRHGRCAFRRSD